MYSSNWCARVGKRKDGRPFKALGSYVCVCVCRNRLAYLLKSNSTCSVCEFNLVCLCVCVNETKQNLRMVTANIWQVPHGHTSANVWPRHLQWFTMIWSCLLLTRSMFVWFPMTGGPYFSYLIWGKHKSLVIEIDVMIIYKTWNKLRNKCALL